VQPDHLTAEQLAAYLEGLVRDDERREIEAHLIACTGCLDEVLALLRLVGLEPPGSQPPLPPT
jgi:anti-sigma factor RsiW